DQLVFRWRLHRQIGWLLALENTIDVSGCAPVLVGPIRPVEDQAAAGDDVSVRIDCGQLVPSRQRDDQIVMQKPHRARRQNQTAVGRARECRDGALDLAGVAHIDRVDLHPERRRYGLDDAELDGADGYGGIAKDRHARYTWRDLLEPAQAVFIRHESGGVAARPR